MSIHEHVISHQYTCILFLLIGSITLYFVSEYASLHYCLRHPQSIQLSIRTNTPFSDPRSTYLILFQPITASTVASDAISDSPTAISQSDYRAPVFRSRATPLAESLTAASPETTPAFLLPAHSSPWRCSELQRRASVDSAADEPQPCSWKGKTKEA